MGKNGTCSESQLGQHEYFEAVLNLKKKVNLLQILRIARIEPDDGFYSLDNIVKAGRSCSFSTAMGKP
ncbi:ribonuclease 3 [Quercus suber]|uniref:Ribonuclease 3 n=1 Tax=Quercus suber TaxID=58331 RepID=A0AAW0KI22_QUESU